MDTEDVLLEREAQLAALASYAGEARKAQGRLVLVAGEAGVGKSALVEELQRDLPEAAWFWGACDGLFTPRPLGPLFDIAAKLGGRAARAVPGGRSRARSCSAPCCARSASRMRCTWWWWRTSTGPTRPPSTCCGSSAAASADATVLLIVTYRDEGLTASGSAPHRSGRSGYPAVRPADRPRARCPRTRRRCWPAGCGLEPAALHELTGGNPFYVTEVVAVRDGRGPPLGPRRGTGPGGPAEQPSAREVLDVAALIGARVDLRLLAVVSDGAAAGGWMSCSRPGCWAGTGAGLKFRHEIVRLAVEGAITAAALRPDPRPDPRRPPRHAAATTTPGWPSTPRRPGTVRPRWATRPPPRGGRSSWAHIARPPRSSSGRCGSPAGWIPPPRPGCTTGWPWSWRLLDRWQDAADAGERALALWRAGGRPACARAT